VTKNDGRPHAPQFRADPVAPSCPVWCQNADRPALPVAGGPRPSKVPNAWLWPRCRRAPGRAQRKLSARSSHERVPGRTSASTEAHAGRCFAGATGSVTSIRCCPVSTATSRSLECADNLRAAPNELRVVTNVDHSVHTIPDPKRESLSCTPASHPAMWGQRTAYLDQQRRAGHAARRLPPFEDTAKLGTLGLCLAIDLGGPDGSACCGGASE